jgi:hypothetical protein
MKHIHRPYYQFLQEVESRVGYCTCRRDGVECGVNVHPLLLEELGINDITVLVE